MIPICWLPAETVLKIAIGQLTTFPMQTTTWPTDNCWLLAALPTQTLGLPSQAALGLVTLVPDAAGTVAVDQVTLVHPFRLTVTDSQVADEAIHREPVNWFGPQALVLEKQWQTFVTNYTAQHPTASSVPREAVPNQLAEPLMIADHYWATYATLIHDPAGTVTPQFKHFFTK